MPEISKVKENLLRRIAVRQGYELHKNAQRDPQARYFGLYQLKDIKTGNVYFDVAAKGIWLTAGSVGRALGRGDVVTNNREGTVPIVALELTPDSVVPSDELETTLVMSKERARQLIAQLQKLLDDDNMPDT